MSIISRVTLRIIEDVAKDSLCCGYTITNVCVMPMFERNCPNTGISVEFKYRYKLDLCQKKYEFIVNRYAFANYDGIYKAVIMDGYYMFELSVTTNKDNDIDFDNGVFVCIYNIDSHGEYKLIDKIKIESAKLI